MSGSTPGHDIERFFLVAEGASDGLWDWDVSSNSIYFSPRVKRMLGYTDDELPNDVDAWLALIHPDDASVVTSTVAAFLETVDGAYEVEHRARHQDGSWRWVLARGAAVRGSDGRPVRLAGSYTDVTERKRAEELLREREAQYRGIFDHASDGLIITDLETGTILAANPAICRMHGYTQQEFLGLQRRDIVHPDYHERAARYVDEVRDGGTPWIRADDVRKDGSVFPIEVHGTPFSWQGRPAILAVVRDLSEQARAWEALEARVAERTLELATLIDVSREITSSLDMQQLAHTVCERTAAVTGATSVSIVLVDGGEGVVVGSLLLPETIGHRFNIMSDGPVWKEISHGERMIVADVRGEGQAAANYRATVGDRLDTVYRDVVSWMSVPLSTQERTLGVLSVSHHLPDYFTPHHSDIVATIANQTAVAIENARLHQRALNLAALEERQRLARELHDSVSQALYGIALGARTARAQLDRDPPRAAEPLEYVLSLAEAGLAEMRALIFELRPESLEQEGLVAALEKQAAALRARYRIQIETSLPDEPDVSLSMKEAFYRIAQEAMHNTVKHARANRIDLRLSPADGTLTLEIHDDGRGFDSGGSFPGHLGLHSMRERAEKAGATFGIDSAPGAGTTVRVMMASTAALIAP